MINVINISDSVTNILHNLSILVNWKRKKPKPVDKIPSHMTIYRWPGTGHAQLSEQFVSTRRVIILQYYTENDVFCFMGLHLFRHPKKIHSQQSVLTLKHHSLHCSHNKLNCLQKKHRSMKCNSMMIFTILILLDHTYFEAIYEYCTKSSSQL